MGSWTLNGNSIHKHEASRLLAMPKRRAQMGNQETQHIQMIDAGLRRSLTPQPQVPKNCRLNRSTDLSTSFKHIMMTKSSSKTQLEARRLLRE